MRVLGDILIVAASIVLLGAVGNVIGLSTLLGGAITNAGYVLAIIFGGLLLKHQGNSWRQLGLKKPANLWIIIGHSLINTLRFALLYFGAV